MQVLEKLLAAYRRIATPIADICLATAAATAVLAGIAYLVDLFVRPWDVAVGLLWVAGFYLVLGMSALVRQAMHLKSGTTYEIAGDNETWAENMGSVAPKFFFKSKTIKKLRRERTRDWIADRNRIASSDNANGGNSPQS